MSGGDLQGYTGFDLLVSRGENYLASVFERFPVMTQVAWPAARVRIPGTGQFTAIDIVRSVREGRNYLAIVAFHAGPAAVIEMQMSQNQLW